MAIMTCELQWLLYLLADLSLFQHQVVPLFCDSESALHIAKNPVIYDRTKYIEIDCHIVRESFLTGVIKPLGITSLKQLAKFFTKPLHIAQFRSLMVQLRVINSYRVPACGRP